MNQSDILRHVYETISRTLEELGEKTQLFSVEKGCINKTETDSSIVYLGVSGVSQLAHDKTSQKVIVEEQSYEAPTPVGMVLSITAVSVMYPYLLEVIGCILRYFKDTNAFPLGEYVWHEYPEDVFYMEPLIRNTGANNIKNLQDIPSLSLEYNVTLAINSEHGISFKRVAKTKITGQNIGT